MRRRTFDMVLSGGGIALAGALLVLGTVLGGNANFAKKYTSDQLEQQNITFKAAGDLTEDERKAGCVVENAGRLLTTGKQAECYANEFIGLHLRTNQASGGKTYAELGDVQSDLRAKIALATQTKDPALPTIQKQLADVTAARETVFKGETLRGLLLTSYGFSIFGEKAAQAAMVVYGASALLALLAIAGFVHAIRTPRDTLIAVASGNGTPPEPVTTAPARRPARTRAHQ